ncbi:aldo/keto reductase [Lysobacter korlensis]|uniref:Aldo/keto reductase n=1 Tax=Lysobacter korlensis TaxID=553636 RepID=A0ABV6RVK3_9GAMM
MTLAPSLSLNDGRSIPQLGLGVYKVADSATDALVAGAIDAGYRHIDTATLYRNERGVGAGVRASGVPREELFVTTKVWNTEQGRDATLHAFDTSLRQLGFDYVDLYLIHWPVPAQGLFVETWRTLEELKADGRARSIGVSNFEPHHLDTLQRETDTVPAVNQVELHPWLQQRAVREYDEAHGIVTESWSPLARGRIAGEPVLDRIAAKHGTTPGQVTIRWHLQLGAVVIPKSSSLDRVRGNFDVFGFELDAEDLEAIESLESGYRTGPHPDTM